MSDALNSWADVVLSYLLVGSATAAVLVPLAWVVIKAGRIRAPVYRHMIWLYCLMGITILPVIWLYGPKLTLAVLPTRTAPPTLETFLPINSADPASSIQHVPDQPYPVTPSTTTVPREAQAKRRPFTIRVALAAAWFIGLVLMIARLGVGWYRLRRIYLMAVPAPQIECWPDIHRRKPRLLLTSELHGPVCFGVFRPVILLPRQMYQDSAANDLRMVLAHEMAHIERRDCWTNFFQRAVEAIFFFHPFVWLASWQLTEQREQICDNHVVAGGATADDYTVLLSRLGEQALGRTPLQTVALFEGRLLSRVRSLLDPLRSFQTKLPRWAAITCTLVTLLAFFVFGSVRLAARPAPRTLLDSNNKSLDIIIDADKPKSSEGRVVHFPKGRSLGKLEIQDENVARELTYWFHWTGIKGPEWEYLCEAKGDVHVPAGKRLSLSLNKTTWGDLSWLSKLHPDAVYRLRVNALSAETTRPDDRCMQHIAHLTGLKTLNLGRTGITDRGLRHIRNLPSLEYLAPPPRVTDKGLAYIAELPSLKGLYFSNLRNRVTNTGLRQLAKLTSLEELYLTGQRMGDAGLEHLRALPRLKYLALYGSGFTDKGMVHVKDMPSLRILSFHESLCQITDAGLAHISQMPNLEILCLHGIRDITDDGIAHLTKMRSLRKLEIGSSQVTDRGLAYLAQIKTLERLDLPQDQKGITDRGLAHLGTLPNLRHLAISRIHFIDPKMNKEYYTDKGLAELANCRLLEELYIGSPGVTDEGMRHVAKLTYLRKLMLFGCENVTNEGLAHLTTLKSLKHLYITDSKITIKGLSCLNEIPELYKLDLFDIEQDHTGLNISGLTKLEELTLNLKIERLDRTKKSVITQQVTADDLASLGKLKRLRWLQGINGVTDAGLSQLVGLTNMERLTFGASGLTDEGLKCLANMKKLDLLSINSGYPAEPSPTIGGGLTDEGLRYLEELKLLTYLQIDSDNTFSAAAVQRLRNELPNLYFLNINGSNVQPTLMGRRTSALMQPTRPQRR